MEFSLVLVTKFRVLRGRGCDCRVRKYFIRTSFCDNESQCCMKKASLNEFNNRQLLKNILYCDDRFFKFLDGVRLSPLGMSANI
jgi:organic radical activating enzyme